MSRGPRAPVLAPFPQKTTSLMKKHLEIIIAIAVFIMLLPIGLQVKAQDHRADSLRTLSEAGVTVYRPVAKLKDGAMVSVDCERGIVQSMAN